MNCIELISLFQFDIPGLLIQIESIFTKSESMFSLRQGVKDICMNWNEQNPLGRIIFIQFGMYRNIVIKIKSIVWKQLTVWYWQCLNPYISIVVFVWTCIVILQGCQMCMLKHILNFDIFREQRAVRGNQTFVDQISKAGLTIIYYCN